MFVKFAKDLLEGHDVLADLQLPKKHDLIEDHLYLRVALFSHLIDIFFDSE